MHDPISTTARSYKSSNICCEKINSALANKRRRCRPPRQALWRTRRFGSIAERKAPFWQAVFLINIATTASVWRGTRSKGEKRGTRSKGKKKRVQLDHLAGGEKQKCRKQVELHMALLITFVVRVVMTVASNVTTIIPIIQYKYILTYCRFC